VAPPPPLSDRSPKKDDKPNALRGERAIHFIVRLLFFFFSSLSICSAIATNTQIPKKQQPTDLQALQKRYDDDDDDTSACNSAYASASWLSSPVNATGTPKRQWKKKLCDQPFFINWRNLK
jgi:hypothetical protein